MTTALANKRIVKLGLTALLATGMVASSAIHAKAQSTAPLVVAPARQYITVDPGEERTVTIKFFNQSNAPVSGRVGVVDFIVTDNDGSPKLLFDKNLGLSTRFSAASWVTLPYDRFTIQPTQIEEVNIRIKVPADARAGGRYVAAYFEVSQDIVASDLEASLSTTAPRIVSLINMRVSGQISENAQLKRFEVPKFVEYGPIEVVTEIINKGDYHITPKGQFELFDWFGRKVDEKVLEDRNIFPDASRSYVAKLGKRVLIGKMKVVFTSAYGENGQALTSSAYVWAFPYKMAILILTSIITALFLLVLGIKLVTNRQKKLEKKLQEQINELEDLKKKLQDNFKK